ncbi:hypothetical protein GCM10023116_13910 [Kistimonas scapharcae]|uniref:Uncharacterized protein n=1 Tax=Kistimonas scapharcae TaxID=1036133 RepID=A0ABP8UZT0_9GAMM
MEMAAASEDLCKAITPLLQSVSCPVPGLYAPLLRRCCLPGVKPPFLKLLTGLRRFCHNWRQYP